MVKTANKYVKSTNMFSNNGNRQSQTEENIINLNRSLTHVSLQKKEDY